MIRSLIYDTLILRLTSRWYAEVLRRVPEGAALLDVGIGTAGALLANAALVKRKGLRVTGIDIDADYVEHARRRLRDSPLRDRAEVRLESVYDHHGGPYGAVYFSGSFMLLPEPERALRHCGALLIPGGRIFFTQTIQMQRARWVELIKPMLKQVTSIDFGRVTYQDEFTAQVRAAGLELEELTILARHGSRASCIAVARPASTRREQEQPHPWIQELYAEQQRTFARQNPDFAEWARTAGGMLLCATIGSAGFLRPDGSVWVNEIENWGLPEEPREIWREAPAPERWGWLVLGAHRYPAVAQLLPSPPEGAVECEWCTGSGYAHQNPDGSGRICSRCCGLGWYANGSGA